MDNDRINEVYHGKHSDAETTSLARDRIGWICSQVTGRRVLDLGCSQGISTILLARKGLYVVGLDKLESALRYAARELAAEAETTRRRANFVLAQGANLPFHDEEFDSVVLGEILEHLQYPSPLLAEVRRVLKPGGRVIVTTPFGLLEHADHQRSYYVNSLLRTLAPHYSPDFVGILKSHYIQYLGHKDGDTGKLVRKKLEELQEQRFLQKEQLYASIIQNLRKKLSRANAKYRNITASYGDLKEQLAQDKETASALETKVPEEGSLFGRIREHMDMKTRELHNALQRLTSQNAAVSARTQWVEQMLNDLQLTPTRSVELLAQLQREFLKEANRNAELRQRIERMVASHNQQVLERERTERQAQDRIKALEEQVAQTEQLRQKLDDVLSEKSVYYDKYVNAVRSFQHQKKRGGELEKELRTLRKRLWRLENSRSWRLIRFYWRFRSDFIRGGWAQRKAFCVHCWNFLKSRPFNKKKQVRHEEKLEKFLNRVSNTESDYFVLMFSGTTFIQDHRGNRPIRLTRLLLDQGVPVLFSYWRWRTSEAIPEDGAAHLFQCPIDITIPNLTAIARHDFGKKKKIFVITFPHISCAKFVNVFNSYDWITIYDVRDDWEAFSQVGQAKWYNKNLERYITNNADVVTAVSAPLRAKIEGFLESGHVELSPNALDTRFLDGNNIIVRPLDGLKVVGYVGHLTGSWFDWDSLIWTAQREPAWRFEIIGHSAPSGLALPPNVKYLGPKDFRQIRDIAKGWRVALIPFRSGSLADSVDPIKVYEYLALGLPVVSFRMPQIKDYPYVLIAGNREAFRKCIEKAFHLKMDAEVIRNFLAVNRWEDRVRQLLRSTAGQGTGDLKRLHQQASDSSK